MFVFRRTLILGACLLSATGFAAAHAEMFDAEAMTAALPTATTTATPFIPASPPAPIAQPAETATPAPAASPAPIATPSPASEPKSVSRVAASTTATEAELNCLARVVLYEAGAESRAGQIAVAQVVMNRVRSPRFPNTICGVIHQRGQFSAIRSYSPPRNARWTRALALAREVRAGSAAPVVGQALYFHAARVSPAFARNQTRVARIGGHIFYR